MLHTPVLAKEGPAVALEEVMVKLVHRLAAGAATVLFVAACGGGPGASGTGSQAPSAAASPGASTTASAGPTEEVIAPPTSLVTPGTLTACVDIEYSPMEFFATADETDPNKATGFDVDAARAVAAKLGLRLEIKNTLFDALIPDLQAGRCDVVWSALYVSTDRLQVADAVPYMATGHVVLVTKGNPKAIKAVGDLCGKTISIQSGGLVETDSKKASDDCVAGGKAAITIQGYPKVADEFQQIVLGRVDAIWETDTAVSDWLLKHPTEYEVGFAFPHDKNYGVYYGKGKADIGTALTAAIAALKADGTLADIARLYQMDPATLETVK
jgi:polar amino acid transport system substrate-binding protein